ncbi:MAG: metallophosphoesterase [Desulfobacterales bacterium]|nr:metallophosphoesterase [Desulfobacterales bacterium]
MRIAVLSDIHSNYSALEAVLADIGTLGVDKIISLGDNIGYGPEPEAVIRTLADKDIPSVMGNHEQALLDNDVLNGFNPKAKKALKINKALLSMESMRRISGFTTFILSSNGRFVHGVPPDVISQYVSKQSLTRLGHILDANPEQVVFVGHTHDLAIYESGPNGVVRKKFWQTRVSLAKNFKYIINSGSVGQPRDSHNEATYVIWDSGKGVVESRAVPYDTLRTIRLIKAAGIPDMYAELLKPGNLWCQPNP